MRVWKIAGPAAVCAAALAGCGKKAEDTAKSEAPVVAPVAPASASPPARKPGLWRQTMSTGQSTTVMRLCTDEAFEKQVSWAAGQMAPGACSEQSMTPAAGGGWSFHSVCDMGTGGHSTTEGTATGDFNSKYEVKATTTTTGAAAPQMNGQHAMTMTAEWQGACPADWKPGDVEMPGGMGRMNMASMMGRGAPPAPK